MNFLENILQRLGDSPDTSVVQEIRAGQAMPVRNNDLLSMIASARGFLRRAGLNKGDRCALLAPNSVRWIALDFAIMAEGGIVVPLYSRQAPKELVAMMEDCSPQYLFCSDEKLHASIAEGGHGGSRTHLFDEIFSSSKGGADVREPALPLSDNDLVKIIYTSGTSGEPKGVMISSGNVGFMLRRTSARLDLLMEGTKEPDRVFHYTPFCFAASWIGLLTWLSRKSLVSISTDPSKIVEEMKLAAPHYFLNVPALLERMRAAIEGQFREWGGARQMFFENGREAWLRRRSGQVFFFDFFWRTVARTLIFPAVRNKISPNIRALICGSAPLAIETQLFFMMLGIPVLQVYGLTETTAISTMDDPRNVVPGRVGPAIEGIEMTVGDADEILVRGPNLFLGYWNRPEATSNVMRGGWFHTGDQGDRDAAGNWRITGRIKNLIVLNSGHNVAPEAIEDLLLRQTGAQQAVVVGNGRAFLSAILTGDISDGQVEEGLKVVNEQLPHYKRVRAFYVHREPFSIENGLMTANGKLKREAICERFQDKIEDLYSERKV